MTSRAHIAVDGLSVDFASRGVRAVDGVSLRIPLGQRVALLGPSGAGKSTLLRALLGAVAPAAGSVRVDGRDPWGRRHEVRALRCGTGMVRQHNDLVRGLTARTNIVMGTAGAWTAGDWAALARGRSPRRWSDRVGELADRHGIAECLPYRVEHLSGGQRQRVAVVRALVGRPGVLLADEPTSGLDPVTAGAVIDALLDGRRHTTVVATHELPVARRCDRIVALRHGTVVYDGPSEHLSEAAVYEVEP